jgi:hypothetical protein
MWYMSYLFSTEAYSSIEMLQSMIDSNPQYAEMYGPMVEQQVALLKPLKELGVF